jgi:hypothetical protein
MGKLFNGFVAFCIAIVAGLIANFFTELLGVAETGGTLRDLIWFATTDGNQLGSDPIEPLSIVRSLETFGRALLILTIPFVGAISMPTEAFATMIKLTALFFVSETIRPISLFIIDDVGGGASLALLWGLILTLLTMVVLNFLRVEMQFRAFNRAPQYWVDRGYGWVDQHRFESRSGY